MSKTPTNKSRWIIALELGLLVSAVALLTYSNSFYPFARDQGNYGVAAWEWMNGSALYRDVLVFKPPGTVWVHAMAQTLFGHTMAAIRWMDGLIHLVTAISIYVLTWRWTGRSGWGLGAGLFYVTLCYGFGDWVGAQTDLWLNCSVLVAMTILVHRRTPLVWAFAGAAIGFAFWLKFTYLAAGLPVILVAWESDVREVARRVALMAVGFVTFSVLVVVSLALGGSLDAFFEHITTILPQYAALETGRYTYGFFEAFDAAYAIKPLKWFLLVSLLLLPVVIWRRGRAEMAGFLPAFALLAIGILSCVVQGKFFTYHYGSMLAPAALCLGLEGAKLTERDFVGWGLGFVSLVSVVIWNPLATGERFEIALAAEPREFWNSARFKRPDHDLSAQLEVADWARDNLEPEETLFVWGFEPLINYVSKRRNPTKYIYNFPFFYDRSEAAVGPLLEALRDDPPDAFVIGSRDAVPWATGSDWDSSKLLLETPGLTEFLRANYVERRVVGDRYMIMERNDR